MPAMLCMVGNSFSASFSQTAFSVHYHVLQMHSDKIVDCFHFEANSQNYKAHRRKVCLGTEACEVSVKINNGLNPHINPVSTFSSICAKSCKVSSVCPRAANFM